MNTIRRFFLGLFLAFALPALALAQVDINHADAKALAEALAGIGLVKAEAIVAYRDAHGPFKTVDDLVRVKGIGAKTLDENRNAIVIVADERKAASDKRREAASDRSPRMR